MASQDETPAEAKPAAAQEAPSQTFWMDQQGNVYYATGTPPTQGQAPQQQQPQQQQPQKAAPHEPPQSTPQAAPMMIPPTAPYVAQQQQQQQQQPATFPAGYQQAWIQSQMYADPQFYYGGGGSAGGAHPAMSPYDPAFYHHHGHVNMPPAQHYYAPPGVEAGGSPVQSPVNPPGRWYEMMQAFGQQQQQQQQQHGHDPSFSFQQHADGGMPMMMQQPQQTMPTEWADLKHRVVALCKTRTGSVAIQSQLEHCSPEILAEILHEMLGSIASLISDRYGSHVTRQLVDRSDAGQRLMIWKDIKDRLVKIACTRYGTWTIQALLDAIEDDAQLAALKEALPAENVIKLMKDQHGGHTIARCAQKLPHNDSLFVFEAAANHLGDLCKHKYGCTTLQRMLESAGEAASIMMARQVSAMGCSIAKDQYGNYIIQHVLGLTLASCLESRTVLFNSLKGSFLSLSMHKYGSNIVEKCLKMGDVERSAVVAELTATAADTETKEDIDSGSDQAKHGSSKSGKGFGSKQGKTLEDLIVHPYGNYVAQSALMLCSEEELSMFQARLEAFAEASDKHINSLLKTATPTAADGGTTEAAEGATGAAEGAAAGGNNSGSQQQQGHGNLEPFRKTVHGRKILQKLHMRTNKDKDGLLNKEISAAGVDGGIATPEDSISSSQIKALIGVPVAAAAAAAAVGSSSLSVSVIDVANSDVHGSRTGAAGVSAHQKQQNSGGGGGKGGGRNRGRSRGGNRGGGGGGGDRRNKQNQRNQQQQQNQQNQQNHQQQQQQQPLVWQWSAGGPLPGGTAAPVHAGH